MAVISGVVQDMPASSPATDLPAWRRWLVIVILLTGGIKSALAFTSVVPALQLIAAEFGGAGDSVLSAQFVVTLAPVGMAVSGLMAGMIVSNRNLRTTMFLALGVCTLAGLMQLVVHNYFLLLASRFVLGFSAVVADVSMTSILAAQFSGAARSKLIGFRQAISSIGTVATMLLGGWLAQHYGWRAPGIMFLLPGIMLLLAFIAFDQPIRLEQIPASRERFSVWQLWPLLLLSLVMSIGHTMPSFQMPFLLKENGITSAVLVSRVPALSSTISILSAFAFGFVYARLGPWTLVVAATLMGAGFIGAGLAPGYEIILLCVVIEGVGAGWTIPFFLNRILDRTDPAKRSSAIGLVQSSLFLGHFLNPLITAPVRLTLGIHATFMVVGSALILIAVLIGGWSTRFRNTVRAI
ncbi:MFS transporter [Novosphingobium sp. MD-1]|uniref:MFS transporter n=1 Tax=Novosphingobium sp. MD-1 TaxID=1630648 RepID=UPI00061C6BC3|nr:MFS transporter [Novosphingobium sp. MD-1]GAO53560.1 permeases of the major facilitator superfamily [Novosphingobium sp. MD-1]